MDIILRNISEVPWSAVTVEEVSDTSLLISGIEETADYTFRISFSDLKAMIVGDIDSRLIVVEEALAELSNLISRLGVPSGLIAAWYGTVSTIPSGWVICDGSTVELLSGGEITSPDLRNRFIIGAGTTAGQGVTIGAATKTITTTEGGDHSHSITGGSHSHGLSIAATALTLDHLPAHNHGNGVTDSGNPAGIFSYGQKSAPRTPDSIDNNGNNGTWQGLTETVGRGLPHTHTATLSGDGQHTHSATGGSHRHEATVNVLPPAMGLFYIMKI